MEEINPDFPRTDVALVIGAKTMMLFGDAKSFVGDLIKELAAARAG